MLLFVLHIPHLFQLQFNSGLYNFISAYSGDGTKDLPGIYGSQSLYGSYVHNFYQDIGSRSYFLIAEKTSIQDRNTIDLYDDGVFKPSVFPNSS